jgi:hypothetical protein
MDEIEAPENKRPIPQIEKKAAHEAINIAENPNRLLKVNKFFFMSINIQKNKKPYSKGRV